MTTKKIRDTIRRLLEESLNPESPTYRERIGRLALESVIKNLEDGKPGAVKDFTALALFLEGAMPQEIQVAQARPIVFDSAVQDID